MEWLRWLPFGAFFRRLAIMTCAAVQTKTEHRAMSRELMRLVHLGERALPQDSITEWDFKEHRRRLMSLDVQIVEANEDILSGIASDNVFGTIDSLIIVFERSALVVAGLRTLRCRLDARLEMGDMTSAPPTFLSLFAPWVRDEAMKK